MSPAASPTARPARVRVVPLTADRWPDLVALFGPKGAYGGCWCMYFRRARGVEARPRPAGVRGQ